VRGHDASDIRVGVVVDGNLRIESGCQSSIGSEVDIKTMAKAIFKHESRSVGVWRGPEKKIDFTDELVPTPTMYTRKKKKQNVIT